MFKANIFKEKEERNITKDMLKGHREGVLYKLT